MKIQTVSTYLAAAVLMALSRALAAEPAATVTEKVNIVDHGTTTSAKSPADVGTSIPDGEFLETGPKSRAELTLPSTSITRLGANTVFNYTAESNTVDLESGTILFCKPKQAEPLNIKTAAITAAIVGTTGFVNVHQDAKGHKIFIFGIVEGHATANVNGQNITVGDGDCIWFSPGAKPKPFAYDLPRYVKSSPLLTKFRKTLPNQPYIDAAIGKYNDLKKRGFIQEPSNQIIYGGDIPALSPSAIDSALNARDQQPGPSSTSTPPTDNSSDGNYNHR